MGFLDSFIKMNKFIIKPFILDGILILIYLIFIFKFILINIKFLIIFNINKINLLIILKFF